jgi:CheY-like chemotaxis protein
MIAPDLAAAVADPTFLSAILERCVDEPVPAGPASEPGRGKNDVSDLGARWILVVEDDRDCRDSLEFLLAASGCAVRTAVNGRQALEILRRSSLPAVILLDNLMPTMTGEQFLEERKTDPRLAKVPVVMLSAWEASAAGKPLEVDAYVRKPYDPDRVLALVRGFIGH